MRKKSVFYEHVVYQMTRTRRVVFLQSRRRVRGGAGSRLVSSRRRRETSCATTSRADARVNVTRARAELGRARVVVVVVVATRRVGETWYGTRARRPYHTYI